MNRTRVAGGLDVQRLASAVRGPGIDTRVWISLAIAMGDSNVDLTQNKEGVFVDVKLMPSEEDATARVGPVYAGDGFGIFARIRKDDELVVAVPSGDQANGAVVINRLWSAADKPPQEALDNPEDLVVVVEEARSMRITIQKGGGKAFIDVQDDEGNVSNQLVVDKDFVNAGSEDPDDRAGLDSKIQDQLDRIKQEFNSKMDAMAKARNPQEMYFFPLIPNPANPIAECVAAPLIYFPPGQPPINTITQAEATPANAPMDADAPAGSFVLPKIPPNPDRESGLFPDGEDVGETKSERLKLDK